MLGITQSQQMEITIQGITLGIIYWQKINSKFKLNLTHLHDMNTQILY